jgi:NACHT domain
LKSQEQRGAIWQQNLTKALHSLEPDSFRRAIRTRLDFNEMKDRELFIPIAYRKTYEWIFDPPNDTNWSDFVEWLTGGEPLYWITGKPGAGKSTLMKFIYTHPQTGESLKAWGDDKIVSTYAFFFWNSGSELQMSQEGLLRSLLIQIFNEMPHLVDIGFQHRLEAWTISPPSDNTWSWMELVEAFNRVLKELTKSRKVVLFIDGLDEFDGSHIKLVELIRVILSPNVKACVSSRPW